MSAKSGPPVKTPLDIPSNLSLSPSLAPQWSDADGFYEQLLDAHADLSLEESQALNARLILLLANQIGQAQVLAQCIALARHA